MLIQLKSYDLKCSAEEGFRIKRARSNRGNREKYRNISRKEEDNKPDDLI